VNFIQAFKMAIKSIVGNKVRSLLTMLGVIIGVGAVIVATAFAEGSTKNIMSQLEGIGTNLVSITITGRNSNRNVTYEQLKEYQEKNSDKIAYIAPTVTSNVTTKYGTKSGSSSLVGTSPDYEIIQSRTVKEGRFITPVDVDLRMSVALVGTAVVNDVFEGANPIGKDIKVNGQVFRVVGVLEEKAAGADQSTDDQIIIPVSVATRLTRNSIIRNFSLQVVNADESAEVVEDLTAFLTDIYKSSSAFRVFNQAQMVEMVGSITGVMMLILGGIATISLVVGGIGIMNIMLVSVTERTREIGIRKAIGAKRKSIIVQFLIEAIVVTGLGGIIGVLMGLAIIKFVIGGLKIVPEVYSIQWISVSFGISLVIGVVFGIYPAQKAAKLNPIDALMYE
jgi:putative ABC transport system permease protein